MERHILGGPRGSYNPGMYVGDNQDPFGFLVSQTSRIEPRVNKVRYPDIQYPQLIPVDTSAPEWVRSITYFSSDKAGEAGWFSQRSQDMKLATTWREKHDVVIEMAAIGYEYDEMELRQAMMIPGMNLQADRAMAARRAYEEFVDKVALEGDETQGWPGLFNATGVTVTSVAEGAAGGNSAEKKLWSNKTADEILKDINDLLSGVWTDSRTVETANTLLLPPKALSRLATMPRNTYSDTTVLTYVKRENIFTNKYGTPLMIRECRGLEDAGAGDVGRMIAYRKDPQVLKLHLPMPHRFLKVWQSGPLTYQVPGIFRMGGVEVRLPRAMRYADGLTS